MKLVDLVRRAERDAVTAKRAAEQARYVARSNPDDLELRFVAEDREQAARDLGRDLADLRREAAAEAAIDRLQDEPAGPDGPWYRSERRGLVETSAGYRARQDHGQPLIPGAVAFDARP